jgi:hypothetical protein
MTDDQIRNYDIAVKAEMKRVIRHFCRYTGEQRANHADSFRLGYKQRKADGHFFYTHPDIPGIAFDRRKQAAEEALNLQTQETKSRVA